MYDLRSRVHRFCVRIFRFARPFQTPADPRLHNSQSGDLSRELERLEPRIVLSASPSGMEQILEDDDDTHKWRASGAPTGAATKHRAEAGAAASKHTPYCSRPPAEKNAMRDTDKSTTVRR